MTWATFKDATEKAFPKGTEAIQRGIRFDLNIPCSGGHTVIQNYTKRIPPEGLKANLARQGWSFKKKTATCPDCMKKDEEPMPETKKSQPTDTARRARRDTLAWLDESFDPDKGQFKGGSSDKTIATETGLAEAAVIELREEFYGPLKEPKEVAELRAQITSLETRVKEMQGDASRLAGGILDDLKKLSERIDKLCNENGW